MDQKNVVEEQAKINIMITVKVMHVKATFQKSAKNSNFKKILNLTLTFKFFFFN